MTQDNARGAAAESTDAAERPPVIESASATTDPANASSGPFAYVVTALAVLLLVLLVSGFTGCAASIGRLALTEGVSQYGTDYRHQYEYDYEDNYPNDLDDLFDDFDELLGQPNSRFSSMYGGQGGGSR